MYLVIPVLGGGTQRDGGLPSSFMPCLYTARTTGRAMGQTTGCWIDPWSHPTWHLLVFFLAVIIGDGTSVYILSNQKKIIPVYFLFWAI